MSENDVLATEIRGLRDDMSEMRKTMDKVADALERLARLEERHSSTSASLERAFTTLAKLELRIAVLEKAEPVQRLTSGWVLNAVWGAVGVVAAIVLKKVGVL